MAQQAQGNKGQLGPRSDRCISCQVVCSVRVRQHCSAKPDQAGALRGQPTCKARLPSSNLPRLAGAASGAGPLGRATCRAARLLGCATSTGTACWHRTGAQCIACGRAQLLRTQFFTSAPACAQTRAAEAYVTARALQPQQMACTNKKYSVTMSKRRLPVLRELQHCWRHFHKHLYQGRAPACKSHRLEQTRNQQRAQFLVKTHLPGFQPCTCATGRSISQRTAKRGTCMERMLSRSTRMPALLGMRALLGHRCIHALHAAACQPALAGCSVLTSWCCCRPAEGCVLLRTTFRASNAVNMQGMSTAGSASQQLDVAVGVVVEGRPLNRDR